VGDSVDRVQQARFNEQYELALTELREAIRAGPGDAELRLLLAEVYLDLEQGDLARTAIEQALERGLAPQRASLPMGRALFLERRWSDLLDLEVPPDLGIAERITLLYLQAEARAARSGSVDGSDDIVVSVYIELFSATDANADIPEIASLAT
jgi:tetratricopeptide (TPR) repeat protein